MLIYFKDDIIPFNMYASKNKHVYLKDGTERDKLLLDWKYVSDPDRLKNIFVHAQKGSPRAMLETVMLGNATKYHHNVEKSAQQGYVYAFMYFFNHHLFAAEPVLRLDLLDTACEYFYSWALMIRAICIYCGVCPRKTKDRRESQRWSLLSIHMRAEEELRDLCVNCSTSECCFLNTYIRRKTHNSAPFVDVMVEVLRQQYKRM